MHVSTHDGFSGGVAPRLHWYPVPQAMQTLPALAAPQCASLMAPVQHMPSGMQHPVQFEALQSVPEHTPPKHDPRHVVHWSSVPWPQ
jgi:hypothetical protein